MRFFAVVTVVVWGVLFNGKVMGHELGVSLPQVGEELEHNGFRIVGHDYHIEISPPDSIEIVEVVIWYGDHVLRLKSVKNDGNYDKIGRYGFELASLPSLGYRAITIRYNIYRGARVIASADLNKDGEINFSDFLLFVGCFGMKTPCP